MSKGADATVAAFALNEVSFAGLADRGALARWRVKFPACMRCACCCGPATVIDAAEMVRIGLINEIVAQDHLMARAMQTVEHIAGYDQFAVQIAKQGVTAASMSGSIKP